MQASSASLNRIKNPGISSKLELAESSNLKERKMGSHSNGIYENPAIRSGCSLLARFKKNYIKRKLRLYVVLISAANEAGLFGTNWRSTLWQAPLNNSTGQGRDLRAVSSFEKQNNYMIV